MKKIVEVEYVGIEDIQEISDDAFAIMKNTNHHISISMSNTGDNALVQVWIMLDGFDMNGKYDYNYMFYIDDSEQSVVMMNSCKNTLKNILAEE